MTKLLILLNGLPGSGKTTYSRQQEHVVVRPDSLRKEWGCHYHESMEPIVRATCLAMTGMLLQDHDTVTIDKCFPGPDIVKPWRRVARDHGAWVRMEVLPTSPWLCTTRKLMQVDEAPWGEIILGMATGMFDNWGEIKGLCDECVVHDLDENVFLMGLGQWKQGGGEPLEPALEEFPDLRVKSESESELYTPG